MMVVRSAQEIRRAADQAYAEMDSGVVAGDAEAFDWLDGLEQGLRWAAGDEPRDEVAELLDRARRADANLSKED